MNRPIRKLLSIVLIFLLAVSPLQSVFADMLTSIDQTDIPCHMPMNQSDTVEVIQPSANLCDMCATASDCNDSCNTPGHCASNVMGLFQGLLPLANNSGSLSELQFVEETIKQQTPALFRPPRV